MVPPGDPQAVEAAVQPNTRLLFSEAPTNPYLYIVDLEQIVAIATRHRLRTMIDSTFATPYNQNPLDFGIDLVMHSATKYLGGHNDLMAGVIAGSTPMISALRQAQGVLGGITDPNTAYLLLRGLKTFALRMQQHNANGCALAAFLETHPKVRRVYYPGLTSHPSHAIARQQMRGFGGVVSFEIDGTLEQTSAFIDALRIPYIAPSLGGVESLVEQPALMSYYELTPEERQRLGISDGLVRYAAGIEDTDAPRAEGEMPGPSPADRLDFPDHFVEQVRSIVRQRTVAYQLRQRATLVLLLHTALLLSNVQAAAEVHLHPNAVRYGRRRWANGGFGLEDAPGRGRKVLCTSGLAAAVRARDLP